MQPAVQQTRQRLHPAIEERRRMHGKAPKLDSRVAAGMQPRSRQVLPAMLNPADAVPVETP
jgi:hypothetical protein